MFPRRPLYRLRSTALGAVIGLALVAPAPAAAAPRDAIIDPNSPSGTEYDLPLDRARDEASGGSAGGRDSIRGGGTGSRGSGGSGGGGLGLASSGGSGGGSGGGSAGAAGAAIGGRAPLFGVGIAAAGESVGRGSDAAGGGRSGDGSRGKGSSRSGDRSSLAQAGEAARRAQDAAARTGSPGDTNSARTWLVALVAAILAAGGLVGLLVRRASRKTDAPSYLQ